MCLSIALPGWPDLEYFDALASKAKIKINFFSQMRRWTSPRNEGSYNVLNPLCFKLIKH